MQIEALYKIFKSCPKISTDTRKILKDSIFFALKGENFNGNEFAQQAIESGAKYAVVDEGEYATSERIIRVDDVLTALQELAKHHRQQLAIPVIGITGTNGKTTSKELIYATLSTRYKVLATPGNLNNHIGVPLTLLSIDSSVEIAVIEMGANHIGEIAFLCSLAQPNYGLITNVGKAHLEGFGSFDGVKIGKGELYDYLAENHGAIFLQKDNEHLREMMAHRHPSRLITYSLTHDADVNGKIVSADPLLTIKWEQRDVPVWHQVESQLSGSYNLENIIAAIAVGLVMEISPEEINKGISKYTPQNNRSQL